MKTNRTMKNCLRLLTAASLTLAGHAADVTWNGGNYTWQDNDSDSFGLDTYNNGDNVTFGNTGITNTTTGETAIAISGTLTPGNVTFTHTQARYLNSGGTNPGGGFNYLFTSNGTSNVINATGDLSLGEGNTIFRANSTNGTYNHSFAGALNYTGGTMLGLDSDNAARIVNLSVGSLAAPTKGNSILFNSLRSASGNVAGSTWSTTTNRLTVTGSKPAVTNGMVSPGLQHYRGSNILGNFMTFDGNTLIPATANYTGYAADWSAAAATEIVNLTAATTLTGSGAKDVHALRVQSGNQNLGGRAINLGSGGLITTSATISNGTLNFGSGPGFIGAYNTAAQGTITATITGSGGLTILGTNQSLNLNAPNSFTGGLFINGGNVALSNNTANGNDVTVGALGRLTALFISNVVHHPNTGGLSGAGQVAAFFQGDATKRGHCRLRGDPRWHRHHRWRDTVTGTLAPGTSPGTLTFDSTLTFDTGSKIAFEPGTLSDLISFTSVADNLGGSGNATLELGLLTGFSYANTYTIFQNTSTAGFTLADITGYDDVNYTANFFQSGNNYQLNFTAVPEPGSALTGGLLTLFALLRRRR